MFPASDSGRILRAMLGVVSVACLALAGWLAWHHPLAPVLAAMLLLLWSAASFLWPAAWLFVVPALLPVIDLTQWTGLLTIEEFDILVLGAAAGTYASMAWHGTAFGADEASAPFDASPSSGSASLIGNAKRSPPIHRVRDVDRPVCLIDASGGVSRDQCGRHDGLRMGRWILRCLQQPARCARRTCWRY